MWRQGLAPNLLHMVSAHAYSTSQSASAKNVNGNATLNARRTNSCRLQRFPILPVSRALTLCLTFCTQGVIRSFLIGASDVGTLRHRVLNSQTDFATQGKNVIMYTRATMPSRAHACKIFIRLIYFKAPSGQHARVPKSRCCRTRIGSDFQVLV